MVEAENERWRQKMSGGGRKRSGRGRKQVVEAEDGQWRQKTDGRGRKWVVEAQNSQQSVLL